MDIADKHYFILLIRRQLIGNNGFRTYNRAKRTPAAPGNKNCQNYCARSGKLHKRQLE